MRRFASLGLVLLHFIAAPGLSPAQERSGGRNETPAVSPSRNPGAPLLVLPARVRFSELSRPHALSEISRHAGVAIAFSPSLLPEGEVSCECAQATVAEALEHVLRNTGLTFVAVSGRIIVQRVEPSAGVDAAVGRHSAGGTIAGKVVDSTSGRAVSGAQITIAEGRYTVLADAEGRYVLKNVPRGNVSVHARMIGYAPLEERVAVGADPIIADLALDPDAISFEKLVVTVGSTIAHSAVSELTVPVDIFSRAEIAGTAKFDMADVLQKLSPAINYDRPQIADLSSGIRPFQMRGLSPDHSLVLIDGKRRHPTAVVHVFGSVVLGSGSSGVDMNAIPSQALERIEILRDGAAAQYGSDAIAGVVNLALKNSISPATFRTTYGLHTPGGFWGGVDGQRWELSGNVGRPLLGRGVINLTGQVSDRKPANRACPDSRDQIVSGDADLIDWERCELQEKRNPVRQPTFLYGDGESRNYMGFLNARFPIGPGLDRAELYALGGLSQRRDLGAGNFRRAIQNVNWRTMYPQGFLPMFDVTTRDITALAGVRGSIGGWSYDLSLQMGQNRVQNDVINSLNTSLGPCFRELGDPPCAPGPDGILGTEDDPGIPNQTIFDTGSLQLSQYSVDLTTTRAFGIGLTTPATLAVGSTFRVENYRIRAGEPASYIDGGHLNQNGEASAAGSQVFFGFAPSQTVDAVRGNLGVFTELEAHLRPALLLAFAGRFEDYSDFGSTLTGKVAVRWQPIAPLNVRATASTGFRAPALSQRYYAHLSTAFRVTPDRQTVPIEIGEFPVDSPVARALGAKALHEESSRNFSTGFTYSPITGFTLTADAYLIRIFDRITLSNSLNVNQSTEDGRRIIEELLAPYGVTDVKYFMNAFHTEVTGVDLTARYRKLLDRGRGVQGFLSYNFNHQKLIGTPATPSVLSGMGTILYPEAWRIATTKGRPRDRLNAGVHFDDGPFSGQVSAHYYGKIVTLLSEDPYLLRTRRGKTTFDIDFGYEFRSGLGINIGMENLLNAFPDRNVEGFDSGGRNPYPSDAWGRNGRFIYCRASVSI